LIAFSPAIKRSILSIVFVLGNEMILKNNKNNNAIITAAAIVLSFLTLTAPPLLLLSQSAQAMLFTIDREKAEPPKAPVVVSAENIYVAWWTNNTENNNEEVMFRASNDGGATFGDKMNLSNSPDADSWRVEIAAEGADVVVTWWETNQTSDTPVARISADGGQTFGPVLRLASNGTISSTETTTTAAGEEGEAE
jgi:hypothetical protein